MYEFIKGLSARCRVDVLTLVDANDAARNGVAELRASGFNVVGVAHDRQANPATFLRALRTRRSLYGTLFASKAFADTLRARLESEQYDIVQCEFPYTAQYAPRRRTRGRPVWVLDAHNVEFRLNATIAGISSGARGAIYRAYASRERRLRREEELDACRRMDRVITVSRADAAVLGSVLPSLSPAIVPNGVDVSRFTPSDVPEEARSPSAVFVGRMDYRPNVDAVHWFCSEILPLVQRVVPAFTFTICGTNPVPSVRKLDRLEGVEVTGRVADPRPYLDRAAVAVTPIRAGSGTRLKILEALAMGRPVVATTLASEGLETVAGKHLMIANQAADFADQIVHLLENQAERRRLGQAGREFVERRHDWKTVVSMLEEVYAEMLAEGRPVSR